MPMPPIDPNDSIYYRRDNFVEGLNRENMQLEHLRGGNIYIMAKGSRIKLNMVWNYSNNPDHLANKKASDYNLEAVLNVAYAANATNLKQHFVSFTSPMLDKVFLVE